MSDENIQSAESKTSSSSLTTDPTAIEQRNVGGSASKTETNALEIAKPSTGLLGWFQGNLVTALLAVALVLAIGVGTGTSIYFARQAQVTKDEKTEDGPEISQELARGKVAEYALQLQEVEELRRRNELRQANILLDRCPKDLRGWEYAQLRHMCRTPTFFLPGEAADILLFNPEGTRVVTVQASSARKSKVIVWDVETTKQVVSFTVPTTLDKRTSQIAYGPKDLLAVIVGEEQSVVELYSARTGKKLQTFRDPSGSLTCVDLSADGRLVVAGSKDGAKAWFADTAKEFFASSFRGQSEETKCVRIGLGSGNSLRLVTAHPSKLLVWSIGFDKSNKPITKEERSLKIDDFEVRTLTLSPDGKWLGVGGAVLGKERKPNLVGRVQLWDVEEGKQFVKGRGHNTPVQMVNFDLRPNAFGLVSAAEDGSIYRWDIGSRHPFPIRSPFPEVVGAGLRWEKGKTAWQAGRLPGKGQEPGHLIQVLPIGPKAPRFMELSGPATSLAIQNDGRQLIKATIGKTNLVESIPEQPTDQAFYRDTETPATHLAFDANDQYVTAATSTHLHVWSWQNEADAKKVALPQNTTHGLCPIPESSRIAVARSNDGKRSFSVQTVDVTAGKIVSKFNIGGPIVSLEVSKKGKHFVVVVPGKVQIWKADDLSGDLTWERSIPGLRGAAFTPDENELVTLTTRLNGLTGTTEGLVTKWSLSDESSDLVRVQEVSFTGVFGPVTQATFTPGLERFVTASGNTIRVWDAKTGQPLFAYRDLPGAITRLTFSRNGQYLLCGTRTNQGESILIWEAEKAES
ncbi:MAG: WD40 repeat domain-containing protein [Gemmataceae bacterium]